MSADLEVIENNILDFERSHNLLELWLRSLDVKDSTKQAYKYGALEFIKWKMKENNFSLIPLLMYYKMFRLVCYLGEFLGEIKKI